MRKLRWSHALFVLCWLVLTVLLLISCTPAANRLPLDGRSSISVVMDNNYPPYVFVDANGNLQGVTVDQWKLWEQKTGIKVNITALPWGQALDEMLQGKYDVIDTIFYTSERDQLLDFTEPYADINVNIFFNKNISGVADVDDLKGFRVAVKSGDANADYLLQHGITDLVFYDSYEEIVRAAAAKNESIFVMDQPPGIYFLYKYNAYNQFNYSPPLYGGQFHRAVKEGDAATLALVSNGFALITPSEDKTIHDRWFGTNYWQDIHTYVPYMIIGAIIAVVIILVLLLFSMILRSRVNRKTRELQESEAIFSSFLEYSPVYVFFKDSKVRTLRLSKNYEEMLGVPVQQAIGKTMDELFPSDLAKNMVADDLRILNEGQMVEVIEKLGDRTYATTKFPIYKDGKPNMLAGFTLDITARTEAEEALRASEEKLRRANELLHSVLESPKGIIIFSLDKDYRYTAFTLSHKETMKAIWGAEIKVGMSALDAIQNLADRERAKSSFDRALKGEHFVLVEEYGNQALKRSYWEDHYSPIFDQQDQVVGLTVFVIDISERMQALAALRESESKLRTVTENAPDTILQINQQGIIQFVNRPVPGLSVEQILGTTVYAWVPPDQHPILTETLHRVFTTGERQEYESLGPGPNGEWRAYSVRVMPVVIDGKAESAIYIATDISDRKKAENALRESEENYRHLVELSPDAIIVHREGKVVFVNSSSVKLMRAASPADILGKPVLSFVHPDSVPAVTARIQRMLAQGERAEALEEKFVRLDGSQVDVEVVAMPIMFEDRPAVQVVARDITERKKMTDALKASEEKYRTLIETINTGIFMSSLDGRFLQANSAVVAMSGYDNVDEFMRIPAANLYANPEDRVRFLDDLNKFGFVKNFQVRSLKKDGTSYWLSISAVLLKDEMGNPKSVLGSITDITERKNADDLIQKSEQRWRTLIENSADALTLLGADGEILYEGPTVPRLTGYSVEERKGRSSLTNIYPEDLEMVKRTLSEVLAAPGNSANLQFRSIRRDGTVWWTEGTATNLLHDPNVHAIVVNYRDVTARKTAENELRESENRFRILFENAGVGVAELDSTTGQFLRINQKYCDIVGYTQAEMLSSDFKSITYPDDLQADLENMERLRSGKITEFIMEKRYIRKNGTIVWILLIVSPMWMPGQEPSTHIAVVHDITEQKRAEYSLRYSEAQVRKLNAELEQRVAERTAQLEVANKELEAFAYSVSHDLRAPLRAIDGFSRILIEDHGDRLGPEVLALLDRIRSSNHNMSQLVDALLGLSRMTRAEMRREKVDLSQMAKGILENYKQFHPERQVTWQVADSLSADGDARLLRVVMENLLGNAWKFTSHQAAAQIEFGAEYRDGQQVFYVRDNGAGFNPAYVNKLFGAFQRLHRADEFEGTGIGLATVQRIIHRHGGKVWAEGAQGKGATFYFTLE